jgi:hypothetical protein
MDLKISQVVMNSVNNGNENGGLQGVKATPSFQRAGLGQSAKGALGKCQ